MLLSENPNISDRWRERAWLGLKWVRQTNGEQEGQGWSEPSNDNGNAELFVFRAYADSAVPS